MKMRTKKHEQRKKFCFKCGYTTDSEVEWESHLMDCKGKEIPLFFETDIRTVSVRTNTGEFTLFGATPGRLYSSKQLTK